MGISGNKARQNSICCMDGIEILACTMKQFYCHYFSLLVREELFWKPLQSPKHTGYLCGLNAEPEFNQSTVKIMDNVKLQLLRAVSHKVIGTCF